MNKPIHSLARRAVANRDCAVAWSFVLPTYCRPDTLNTCLQHLRDLDGDRNQMEVLVYDNGTSQPSGCIVERFQNEIPVTYVLNEPGHGLGYSLVQGVSDACGEIIIELNDDAHVPPDFLTRVAKIFASDPMIGIVGVRALEAEYQSDSRRVGCIDESSTEVVGNFDRQTGGLLDVDHVYGFCYAYRRTILEQGAVHDKTLLSQDFSSGNRIETDHCLSARALGYRVVYDSSIAVTHLAKPRPDLDERSLVWKLNHWRNTLYMFLKHFGPFGRNALAVRFACKDIGLLSFLRSPSRTNWLYLWTGIRARVSAIGYWFRFLMSKSLNRTSKKVSHV